MILEMSSRLLRACLWVSVFAWLCAGCVISTAEPAGTPPDVPLPPRPEVEETAAPTGPALIRARHILIAHVDSQRAAPYVTRTRVEAEQFAEQLRQLAQQGQDFAALAKEHSDDRGSAAAGGDLGEFRREQMVPEFSNAAFGLDIGEVSAVVESPFGFHVIQRTD